MASTPWAGAVNDHSIWIRAEFDGSSARLAVSRFANLADPVFYDPDAATAGTVVSFRPFDLAASQQYYYALEIDGVLEQEVGRFKTLPTPGLPGNATVAVASCAGSAPEYPGINGARIRSRISNSPAHGNILDTDPDMLVHLGDIAYYDPGSGNHGVSVGEGSSPEFIREMFRDVFRQPNQAALYRNIPTAYVQDDHDGGPNNHDKLSPSYPAFNQVYRERVPHYPLPLDNSQFQSWMVARTQWVLWDERSGRTPVSAPDNANKTMLGFEQREAFEQVLATSNAEALVICNPGDWASSSRVDSWASYDTERQWVISKLAEYGWSGKTVMVGGDLHALGLDTGTVSPGGIPLLHVASIDSSPSGAPTYLDMGGKAGRSHYGTVSIQDYGNRIDITLTGYEHGNVWKSYTHSIAVEQEPPPPPLPEAQAPGTSAEAVPTITWYAHDLLTGRRIARVAGASGDVSRALGAYESATITVPTPLSGPLANRLITHHVTPPNTLMVAEINNVPAWSGIVWKTEESSEGGYVLGCATPESYLDRRFTRSLSFEQVEQVEIMARLAAVAADSTGIPLEYDLRPTGVSRDRHYYDDEDATVYQRVQELSAVIGGPEWTIRAEYADKHGSVVKLIFVCGASIGAGRDNPRGPISTLGKAKATWTFTKDWTKGAGANAIIATSSGEGEKRPQSVEMADIPEGQPKVEFRFSPSSSVKEVTTLNSHANAKLDEIGGGTESLEISARWDQAPMRLGVDIDVGDWAEYVLYGPSRPAGLTGVKRMIGYKLGSSSGRFSPVFLEN